MVYLQVKEIVKNLVLILMLAIPVAVCLGEVEQSWVQRWSGTGTGDAGVAAMAVDFKGNVIVTGGAINTNGYPDYDYVTIKYSKAGEPLWTNIYDGLGNRYDRPVG